MAKKYVAKSKTDVQAWWQQQLNKPQNLALTLLTFYWIITTGITFIFLGIFLVTDLFNFFLNRPTLGSGLSGLQFGGYNEVSVPAEYQVLVAVPHVAFLVLMSYGLFVRWQWGYWLGIGYQAALILSGLFRPMLGLTLSNWTDLIIPVLGLVILWINRASFVGNKGFLRKKLAR